MVVALKFALRAGGGSSQRRLGSRREEALGTEALVWLIWASSSHDLQIFVSDLRSRLHVFCQRRFRLGTLPLLLNLTNSS